MYDAIDKQVMGGASEDHVTVNDATRGTYLNPNSITPTLRQSLRQVPDKS